MPFVTTGKGIMAEAISYESTSDDAIFP